MKKAINLIPYSLLTIINIAACLYFIGFQSIGIVLVLFATFFVNQYMLVDGIMNLLDDNGNKKRSVIYLTLKIFVLIFGFWFAMRNNEKDIYVFVGNYIFQLIILGISIKSDTKKILKEGL